MKSFLSIAAAVMVAGCGSPAISRSGGGSSPTETTTSTVKRQNIVGYVFFNGKLVIPPAAQATAYSPYDTPIVSVLTSVGKHVERGDTIVKLSIPGADSATTAAKESTSAAAQNYAAAKSAASAPVKQAEQALEQAKANEKAAEDTVAAGGTADVEGATQAREAAEAALQQAQQQMNQSVEPSKESLNESAAELAAVRADARKGLVRAPISGMVVSLNASPGTDASAGKPLATIVNYRAVQIQAIVPPELKSVVTPDAKVIVAFAGPNWAPVNGRVEKVTVMPPSAGQASPGYLAVIRIEDPDSITQPSLSIERVGVRTGYVENAIAVPVGAVTTQNGQTTVAVQQGDKWVSTPVQTGISDGAVVEIKSGLTEGQTVRVVNQPLDSTETG
ncbi:MAG TPA: HlyD family efflux transporter periplasmic adaptor subunit [Fimbriimonadaceae bacterium]|nr:HlyD family efflux transporter periplasmic adaptor subunit [Fimbriimonadaceae bacterium]